MPLNGCRNLAPASWPVSLWLSSLHPSLIYLLAWYNYVCLYTCPGSVIGKDRVLNELPFMSSSERCPQPIKKSSLIKRSAILIHVIKLDLVFLHRTKLSSSVQLLDVHQWQFNWEYAPKITCNAPYGICMVFMSQAFISLPSSKPTRLIHCFLHRTDRRLASMSEARVSFLIPGDASALLCRFTVAAD